MTENKNPDETPVTLESVEADPIPTPIDPTPPQSEETPAPEVPHTPQKGRFIESLPVAEPLPEDKPAPSINELVVLFREQYSKVNELLTQHEERLEAINKAEQALFNKLSRENKTLTDADGNLWFRTLMAGLAHAQINQTGEAAAVRDDSEWVQSIEHDGKTIRAGRPRQSMPTDQRNTGELVTYLTSRSKVGTVFDVPLYASGLWLRFRTPPLVVLAGLRHQLNQLKISLGAETKGMAFSNTSASLTAVAVDFALQYVMDANVHYTTPSDLKSMIHVTDIPVILTAMAAVIWPAGFPYAYPCTNDAGGCGHIVKEKINIHRLFWTDTLSLTQAQKRYMSQRFKKVSDEERATYLREHQRGTERVVWFENDLGLAFQVPSVQAYEESAKAWIDSIIEMTQGAFNEPPHGTNRDMLIMNMGVASTARQFGHWVTGVFERTEDGEIEEVSRDREVIDLTLTHVFSDEQFLDHFFEAITQYMDDSLISMVAIPSYRCPKCQQPISEDFHERFEQLVPIDALTTFFTLVNLKQR